MHILSEILTEETSQLELLEEGEGKAKQLYIVGPFAVADLKNKNGRLYPKSVLQAAVESYLQEKVSSKSAYGTLGHDASTAVDAQKVSHRIIALDWKDNVLMGKAAVLDEGCGKILRSILKSGGSVGISTRGKGETKLHEDGTTVVESFELSSFDAVLSPSIGLMVDSLTESFITPFTPAHQSLGDQHSTLGELEDLSGHETRMKVFSAYLKHLARGKKEELRATLRGNMHNPPKTSTAKVPAEIEKSFAPYWY